MLNSEIIRLTNQQDIFNILLLFKHDLKSLSQGSEFVSSMADKFSKYAYFYVIKTNTNTLGFISFYANDLENKKAYISMIAVDKNSRSGGIGTKLLDKCIEISKELGITKISLEVNKNNTNAINFYEKKGFLRTLQETINSFFYEKSI